MRAELWTADGGLVIAADCPPYNVPPGAVQFGARTFVLDGDVIHLAGCMRGHTNPQQHCTCGGAYAYREVVTHQVAEMHIIEAGRNKPVTAIKPKP